MKKTDPQWQEVEVYCPACGRRDIVKAASKAWLRCEICGEEMRREKPEQKDEPFP